MDQAIVADIYENQRAGRRDDLPVGQGVTRSFVVLSAVLWPRPQPCDIDLGWVNRKIPRKFLARTMFWNEVDNRMIKNFVISRMDINSVILQIKLAAMISPQSLAALHNPARRNQAFYGISTDIMAQKPIHVV